MTPSIHDQPGTGVLVLQDGTRIEHPIRVDGNRYLPVWLAIDGWLQEFPLDSVVDAWWLAQKRKQEKRFKHARQDAARALRGGG